MTDQIVLEVQIALITFERWPIFITSLAWPYAAMHNFCACFSPLSTFLIEGALKSKNLLKQEMMGVPKNLGVNSFPDPVGHYAVLWWPLGFCRWGTVAGGEQAPLGWYFNYRSLINGTELGTDHIWVKYLNYPYCIKLPQFCKQYYQHRRPI